MEIIDGDEAETHSPKRREGGIWQGRVWMADDFDEPLTDLENELYAAGRFATTRSAP